MAMYFFPNPGHPLGTSWTLSPEPYHEAGALGSDARYLGYSIEDACLSVPVVPVEERENRAYILAKVSRNERRNRSSTFEVSSFLRAHLAFLSLIRFCSTTTTSLPQKRSFYSPSFQRPSKTSLFSTISPPSSRIV